MAGDLQEDSAARRNRNKEDEKVQEPQKSYETILEQEIAAGLTELERPAKALLLSGPLGGARRLPGAPADGRGAHPDRRGAVRSRSPRSWSP